VLGTPGHTAGSVSVLTAAGEAIVGDLLMGGFAGGKLLPHHPTLHYFAEDLPTLRASVRRLLGHAPRRIFVGHGGPLRAGAVSKQFGECPPRS
jgi:glyoxylase-like metal-dependent hydrolase (beta-lactamase superfamily II)